MKRSEARILTTHTGSLPRPAGLVEMLGAMSRGEAVDEAALECLAGEATADVVSAQLAAGVDVINCLIVTVVLHLRLQIGTSLIPILSTNYLTSTIPA